MLPRDSLQKNNVYKCGVCLTTKCHVRITVYDVIFHFHQAGSKMCNAAVLERMEGLQDVSA